ncbi:MAG: hypothetical protein ABIO43_00995 [Sphingomicrobium sp.]
MKQLFLAAGVAALAIAAPAISKPGDGKGGGGQQQARGGHDNGGGGGQAKGGHGGGGPKFESRGGGGGKQFERSGGRNMSARQDRGDGQRKFENRGGMREARVERQDRREFKTRGSDRELVRNFDRRGDRVRISGNDQRLVVRNVDRRDYDRRDNRDFASLRDWDDGFGNCPPGLAKKNNGCLPPGQAKKLGALLPAAYASSYLPDRLRDLYRDDDDRYYRYGDGYLYQVDRRSNLVSSLLPLFGGGYTVGQQFPYGYEAQGYGVPSYYQSFYQDNSDDYYRYNNGYVYDIDRRSGLIENIIPALGYGYGVGEMLPSGYSSYNLPYQYRDVYSDNNDSYYRYAPGAIYQVDRGSNLITSVASLLAGGSGLGIGQQMPMGYSAYNVPYDYRDQYYDTPDNMYRYANGNIYQVDPTTQLITAVIDAIV